jgi:hypothetical protein
VCHAVLFTRQERTGGAVLQSAQCGPSRSVLAVGSIAKSYISILRGSFIACEDTYQIIKVKKLTVRIISV